ncbi:unnamed protein product [Jaminaea pallidilutea]
MTADDDRLHLNGSQQSSSQPHSSQRSTTSTFPDDDSGFLDALATIPLTPQNGHDSAAPPHPAVKSPAAHSEPQQTPQQTEQHPLPKSILKPSSQEHHAAGHTHSADRAADVSTAPPRKRARFSPSPSPSPSSTPPAASSTRLARHSEYLESGAYDALQFGDFATYMRNKRTKLKVQEASLKEQEDALLEAVQGPSHEAERAPIFQGCTMYITGHTNPPYQELRRLIVLHGGIFMAYLDQKKPVTHIIASNLTPRKRDEFRDYRVVRPEWIVQSIDAGRRLKWQDFRVEADAGGAIGAEKLPVSWATDAPASKSSEFLTNGTFRQAAATSNAQQQPSKKRPQPAAVGGGGFGGNYLAEATPWGRAAAQKRLTGFRRQQTDVAGDRAGLDEPGGASPTNVSNKRDRDDDSTVRQVINAKETQTSVSVPPASPDPAPADALPSTPLTASQEEWLAQIETPSKPPAQEVSSLARPASPPTVATISPAAATVGTDAPTRKAAHAGGYFEPSHPYALRPSNTHAAKLLASPSWREQNTATSESFLSGFFAKSRLHYLSTWKGELKDLVSQALKDAGKADGSQPLPVGVNRVIMHVDFDSFFVNVGLRNRPDLVDKAVVVCHAGSSNDNIPAPGTSSTSEIASCNYVARSFGVQNGWSLGRARQVCPDVHPIPYDFEGYKDVSIQFYSLLLAHADAIEAVSVDEALIDVSRLLHSMRNGHDPSGDADPGHSSLITAYRGHCSSQGVQWTEEKQLAEALRDEIRRCTGCEASIGIGANILQARLATRKAKPGGSFHLQEHNLVDFLGALDIDDLQGVGYNTRNRFHATFGTANIADLKRHATAARFAAERGPKLGRQVWDKMHGIDRSELEGAKQRQSVGAAVNYAIRFNNQDEAERFVRNLSEEVAKRLSNYRLKGRQTNVTVMIRDKDAPVEAPKFLGHGICDVYNRSGPLSGLAGAATNQLDDIFRVAWKLIRGLNADPKELRGIAISCTKLEPEKPSVPAKQRGGQCLLHFKTTPSRTAAMEQGAATTPNAADSVPGYPNVDGDNDHSRTLTLTPGPAATPRRRSLSPSSSPEPTEDAGRTSPVRDPMLPPAPTQMPSQPSGPPKKPLPSPFLNHPTRRSTRAANQRLAEEFAMPTMSQLDTSVLSELPKSIRDQVMRDSRRMGSSSSSSSSLAARSSSPLKTARGATTARSLSSSPAKRSLAASYKSSPSHQRQLQFPPVARSTRATWAADPRQISDEELQGLNVDPEVFRALPVQVQRETLMEQQRLLKGKEARFIGSKHRGEQTMSEERSVESQRARDALDVADTTSYLVARPSYLVARPLVSAEDQRGVLPTIQKRSSAQEVENLLESWISKHATRPPRHNDVIKFCDFLTHCIQADGRPGSSMCDVEKVDVLMRSWRRLVMMRCKQTDAGRQWQEALEEVQSKVNAAMRQRFGANLVL